VTVAAATRSVSLSFPRACPARARARPERSRRKSRNPRPRWRKRPGLLARQPRAGVTKGGSRRPRDRYYEMHASISVGASCCAAENRQRRRFYAAVAERSRTRPADFRQSAEPLIDLPLQCEKIGFAVSAGAGGMRLVAASKAPSAIAQGDYPGCRSRESRALIGGGLIGS
jgi:hypothetical protein